MDHIWLVMVCVSVQAVVPASALGAWMWWLRDASAERAKRNALPAAVMAVWMSFVIVNNLRVLAVI